MCGDSLALGSEHAPCQVLEVTWVTMQGLGRLPGVTRCESLVGRAHATHTVTLELSGPQSGQDWCRTLATSIPGQVERAWLGPLLSGLGQGGRSTR